MCPLLSIVEFQMCCKVVRIYRRGWIDSSLIVLFSSCISFDFTCYLPLTYLQGANKKKTTGSFSFLACTLFGIHLINLLFYVNLLDCNNHVHKHNYKVYSIILLKNILTGLPPSPSLSPAIQPPL